MSAAPAVAAHPGESMAIPLPPVPPPNSSKQPVRRALITLRTAVIGIVAALVAGSVATTAMMTRCGPVEILISTGTAFTGTVTFLNKVVE
jgi:hypothetical protein